MTSIRLLLIASFSSDDTSASLIDFGVLVGVEEEKEERDVSRIILDGFISLLNRAKIVPTSPPLPSILPALRLVGRMD